MPQNKRKRLILATLLVVLVAMMFFTYAEAASYTSVKIDKNTINKGYTVSHNQNDVRFAVTPRQVNQEVDITLQNRGIEGNSLPTDKKLVSNIYSFDMIGRGYNPIITRGPSWAALRYNSANNDRKALYYWDGIRNQWIKLPSTVDKQNKYIRANTHLPYSKIAVLEDKPEVTMEGGASWYNAPTRQSAAMRVFDKGDIVKVTNLRNGKSCEVVIADRGPFIPGRIIDLSTDAFAQIASLSSGVTDVKVEKY